jgi:prepilin-type N-terminal cleavage/methylation domain-containing protein
MHGALRARAAHGFTVIELVVALVIAAILLTVAVGGFGGTFSRKRVEAIAGDLVTDLQQARTEAVTRNLPVRLTLGTGCQVLHTRPQSSTATTSCHGATPTAGTDHTVIRNVERTAADTTFTAQPTATPLASVEFDPRNGTAVHRDGSGSVIDVSAGPGILVGSSSGTWQLRVRVGAMGRVELCSPTNPPLTGYAVCP